MAGSARWLVSWLCRFVIWLPLHAGLPEGQEGLILPRCQENPQVKTSEDCAAVVDHMS